MIKRHQKALLTVLTFSAICLGILVVGSMFGRAAVGNGNSRLWSHNNLFAWCVVPFDAKKRGPEERAQMLENLGIRRFAYDWREEDVPTFDAEIEALQRHRIDLLAWWFPFDADSPHAKTTLDIFKRHGVHPHLWVVQSPSEMMQSAETIASTWPKTPIEQQRRVEKESERIGALAKLAEAYGCQVDLYNHNGWFGEEDNQLAIIAHLKKMGITNVGIVYNFSHARDGNHDDTKDFAPLWNKIKSHVVAVNITGTAVNGTLIYPSQGDRELEMMKIIENSGWRGPVGIIGEKGGDAELTLKNYLTGLDWLAAELHKPGSGGPDPFPPVH